MQDHAGLIEALGGGTALTRALSDLIGEPLKRNAVFAWKRNGVAWRYRPAVARLAAEKGVELPADFLGAGQGDPHLGNNVLHAAAE